MVPTTLRRAATMAALVATQIGCTFGPPPLAAEEPPALPPQDAQPLPPPASRDPREAYAAPTAAEDPQRPTPPSDRGGADDVAVEDFITPLALYGAWVDVAPYGRVWQPADEEAGDDLRPYASDGSWAANDDGAWVFQSKHEKEWGWATYHYGRWVDQETYGWVWVPGTIWAPSWVEWRYGGGYVGWAPMGPAGVVVPEDRWVFVDQRRFADPAVFAYRLPPERVHLAFVTAAPIVEVRGSAHWTVGPSPVLLRAAGVQVRATQASVPGRGYVRAQAALSIRTAAERGARPAPVPTLRRGPGAVHAPRSAAPTASPAAAPAPAPVAAPESPRAPEQAQHAAPTARAAPHPERRAGAEAAAGSGEAQAEVRGRSAGGGSSPGSPACRHHLLHAQADERVGVTEQPCQ